MGKKVDLAGRVFGKLTVIKRLADSKWECRCECGNTVYVTTGHLNNGSRTSCGCARKFPYDFKCKHTWYKCKKNASGVCCIYCDDECEDRCLNHPDKCGSR